MAETLCLLQIGGPSLEAHPARPEGVRIVHMERAFLSASLAACREPRFDAAVLFESPDREDEERLSAVLAPHTVFYTDAHAAKKRGMAKLLKKKYAAYLDKEDLSRFLKELPVRFRRGQYGDRLHPDDIDLSDRFFGSVRYEGHVRLVLTGDFGDEARQVLTWRHYRVLEAGEPLEIWPEIETEGTVRATLCVRLYRNALPDVFVREWRLDAKERGALTVMSETRGYLSFSLLAQGSGILRTSTLHVRRSRLGSGCHLPGGKLFCDESGGEFYSYFDPGDLKPPLTVYFSGYRTAEGFEGYHLIRALKTPFLLIGDPRLEGGALYLGGASYEDALEGRIREALSYLGFDRSQLILSGLSMGTCGACYYAARLRPRDVVAGKLLLNAGNVAGNLRKIRPDEFATSLDMLYAHTGGCGEEEIDMLNRRMWDALDHADLRDTRFAISYMRDDDYDMTAYDDLIRHLGHKGVRIYGKGIDGRHNDNNAAVTGWLIRQFHRILSQDFKRSVH